MPSLTDTLKCVATQDYPKDQYEIIIIDNGLTPAENLRELCDETALPPIRYIHEPKNGATNARHTGVKLSKGDFLVFIDDDILCDPTWLGKIVAPLENKNVALVTGKAVLKYEAEPPEWIGQFRMYLSGLDYGDDEHVLSKDESVCSCNMAARRDAFFQVGGLNVCYYGDPKLLHYSGDGECGLARKIHNAGYKIWYSSEAWLYHRVAPGRITLEYMERRAKNAGIETVFRLYRYDATHCVELILPALKFAAKSVCHWVLKWTTKAKSHAWFGHHVASLQHFHSLVQCGRLLCSKKLRSHTKTPTYLI